MTPLATTLGTRTLTGASKLIPRSRRAYRPRNRRVYEARCACGSVDWVAATDWRRGKGGSCKRCALERLWALTRKAAA